MMIFTENLERETLMNLDQRFQGNSVKSCWRSIHPTILKKKNIAKIGMMLISFEESRDYPSLTENRQ